MVKKKTTKHMYLNNLRKACMCVQSHPTLGDPMDKPTRLLCSWDFPGKNTGVDCQSLLQGIFLAQGSAPSLLDYMQVLYHLSHRESPKKSWSPQMQPYTQPSLPQGLGSRGKSGLFCSQHHFLCTPHLPLRSMW